MSQAGMKLRPTTYVIAIETSTPHPDTGRLICIGFKRLGGGGRSIRIFRGDARERAAVVAASGLIKESHIYITWRGTQLLVPFLTAKMLLYGLDPSPLYSARHIDLAALISTHLNLGGRSLYDVCRLFNIPVEPILKTDNAGGASESEQVRGKAVARCKARVAALEALSRRLTPLMTAVYNDLPTLL